MPIAANSGQGRWRPALAEHNGGEIAEEGGEPEGEGEIGQQRHIGRADPGGGTQAFGDVGVERPRIDDASAHRRIAHGETEQGDAGHHEGAGACRRRCRDRARWVGFRSSRRAAPPPRSPGRRSARWRASRASSVRRDRARRDRRWRATRTSARQVSKTGEAGCLPLAESADLAQNLAASVGGLVASATRRGPQTALAPSGMSAPSRSCSMLSRCAGRQDLRTKNHSAPTSM